MSNSDEKTLMCEYVQRFRGKIFWPLRYSGFCRFDIANERVVPKTTKSIITNSCLISIITIGVTFVLWYSASGFEIHLPEALAIFSFAVYSNLRLINLTFFTRNRGSELIYTCIKIDTFLGIRETLFMRDIQFNFLTVLCFFVTVFQIIVNVGLYLMFDVSVKIHIVGSPVLLWLFSNYHDYNYLFSIYTFMVLRVRYMNAALIKKIKMKPEYVPRQLMFHKLFWKNNFDSLITFDKRARDEEFSAVYRMLLNGFQDVTNIIRFSAFLGVSLAFLASLEPTYLYVSYVKSAEVDKTRNTRAGIIISWIVASWSFLLFNAQIVDMFYKELEVTNLICAYSQLKPSYSSDIHKLTKNIMRTLESGEKRVGIYGIMFYNTGLILRLVASSFVYITAQLQMAFPGTNKNVIISNTSIVVVN